MSPLNLFVPISKVDVAQRLVYGVATAETVDRSGEVCDYASTKPFYEKWSGDIAKATDGKSLGNLRAMHSKIAAGKVTSIAFNDDAKQIEICAKVVDDAEWNKVEEGVYTGFSQGGAYVKRWKGEDGVQRYTADPSEVSLVDLPCLPSATFQMVKADGLVVEEHFKTVIAPPSNDEIIAKANELALGAGDVTKWGDYVDAAREALLKSALPPVPPPEAAAPTVTPVDAPEWEQVWKSKRDGATFKTKDELRRHHDGLDAAEQVAKATGPALDAIKGINEALGVAKTEPAVEPAAKVEAASKPRNLEKDLYDVSYLVQTLASLQSIWQSSVWEEKYERDNSAVPGKLKELLAQACDILRDMVAEETGELFGDEELPDVLMIEAAAGKLAPEALAGLTKLIADKPKMAKALAALEKAGARNSKSDMTKIQSMHDNAVSLGASCGKADKAEVGAGLEKIETALAKMTAERDGFSKAITDTIMPALAALAKDVAIIKSQPNPLPLSGQLRAATRGDDNADMTEKQVQDLMATQEGRDQIAMMFLKAAQRNGQPMQFAR